MPDWAQHLRPRLSVLHLSPTRENEIVDELSQHLDDRWRELVAGGASPDEATQLALADFREGNLLAQHIAPLRQAHAPMPVTPGEPPRFLPADLWRDVRHAARMLRKQPGFAIAAIMTLVLAIGATTAIFTVVDALLLRSLPFPDADRLVQVGRTDPGGFGASVSQQKFLHWRSQSRSVFVETAAYNDFGTGFTIPGSAGPERLTGSLVTAGFFEVMGVQPVLGRTFSDAEDVPGGPHLVVLSHALWKNRFRASSDVVGQAISLNTVPYTVIGVMPEGFRYPDVASLWTLFQFNPDSQDGAHNLEVIARLQGDTTLDQARAAMETAGATLRRAVPGVMGDNESVGVRPLRERLYGDMRQALLILFASAGFVLLIGCVNVANLQLAQAAERHHEIALRRALGASTWTIVRQLLVESLLLAVIGGIAGVALAYAGVPALLSSSPVRIPFADTVSVDWRVLAFALAVSLVSGLAFGLLPAWQFARANLDGVLRAGAHRMIGHTSRWTRGALVAGEVALALMLTICAFLLVKNLVRLQSTQPGFVAEHVLTMKLALPEARYGTAGALAQFQEQVEDRITALPGVRAAALALLLPLQLDTNLAFAIEGQQVPGTQSWAQHRASSPGYFEAMQIPLLRGRLFTARDRANTQPVVLINQAAAARYWPGADPVGQRIRLGVPVFASLAESGSVEIVGVVGDVRDVSLGTKPAPTLYLPLSQQSDKFTALAVRLVPFSVVVRADAGATELAHSVQRAIWTIDPQQPITDVRTMEDIVTRSLGSQRFNTLLLGSLASLALLLAAIGLYGVIARIVGQRTTEIGVRMALGATRADVIGMFLRQVLTLVVVGVVAGLIGAFGLTRVLRTLLTDISTNDPWMFSLAPAVMFAVAVLAALRPTLRAAGVDPARALRSE